VTPYCLLIRRAWTSKRSSTDGDNETSVICAVEKPVSLEGSRLG
jgi:hypothetical protein